MNIKIILSLGVALATGAAIAMQSTLNGKAGAVIGPIRTGLLVNAVGGSMALIVLLGLLLVYGGGFFGGALFPGSAVTEGVMGTGGVDGTGGSSVFLIAAAAGFLGILIIVGISFAVQVAGITAGLSAVILAQLVVGMVIDSSGFGSAGAIAADPRRILGVLVMAMGVFLLIPKS